MRAKTNKNSETLSVLIGSLKTVAKCLIVAVLGVYFVLCLLIAAAPSSAVAVFEFFELKRAEEACYISIYNKSNSAVDLYNLIVFEGQEENHKKQLGYLNEMFKREDYEEFCEKLDKSTIVALNQKNKEMIAYTCNSRSFLINQKVECLFELDENVSTFVFENMRNDFVKESSFATCVNFIANSDLSNTDKILKYHQLIGTGADVGGQLINVQSLVEDRIDELDDLILVETNIYEKIVLAYTKMNILGAKYIVCKAGLGGWDLNECKDAYTSAVADYNALVK